jgi:hypothetical protein
MRLNHDLSPTLFSFINRLSWPWRKVLMAFRWWGWQPSTPRYQPTHTRSRCPSPTVSPSQLFISQLLVNTLFAKHPLQWHIHLRTCGGISSVLDQVRFLVLLAPATSKSQMSKAQSATGNFSHQMLSFTSGMKLLAHSFNLAFLPIVRSPVWWRRIGQAWSSSGKSTRLTAMAYEFIMSPRETWAS